MIRLTKKRQEDVAFVTMVAKAYWNDRGKAMEDVAKELDISEGAVSKCIYIAGVKNWISYQMLCDIKTKEHYQQCKHYDEGAKETGSDKYFNEVLFPERRKYIRDHLTKEYCTKVVSIYLENAQYADVHVLMGLSREEMNDIIIKGSILRMIPDGTFRALISASILRGGNQDVLAFIKSAREDYFYLPGEIQEREEMLRTYDEVYSDADEAPSKEEIQNSIDQKKAQLERIKRFVD